jgi:rhomboid protease GluP
MAFGLSPRYIKDFPLEDLTAEQFLIIAIEAAKKLNWNVGYTSETGFIAFTRFSMTSWSEEVKIKINGSVANLKSECTGSQMVDWGKNEKNIKTFITAFNDLRNSISPEELAQKYNDIKSDLVSKDDDALSQPPSSTKEKLTSFISIFKPTQGYFITPIIIDINILIFILMVISGVNVLLPDGESLIKWGANFRMVTLDGQWWRLITNVFLHIGVFHLLMNMYALLYIGLLLEPHLGKTRFAVAYFLTGISASVVSLWWHSMTISAGASGAIFGMYGVFLALLTSNLIEKSARKALLTSIIIFVGYNLLNGLKGGIDNAAHIGGLISGLIIGYSYIQSMEREEEVNLKYVTIGILSLVFLSASFIVYKNIPNDISTNDIKEYDYRIQKFVSMESMAMEVYNMPEGTSKEALLSEIKNRGLYYWNQNIELLTELDKLAVPAPIHERNKKLVSYCNLRIKCFELMYKAIDEDTDTYKPQIEDYNRQIQNIITELTGK